MRTFVVYDSLTIIGPIYEDGSGFAATVKGGQIIGPGVWDARFTGWSSTREGALVQLRDAIPD